MRYLLTTFFLALSCYSIAQQKKTKILLIGVFHFNNPGHDVKKEPDFDILSDRSQHDLELLSDKIRAFKPTRFFVEWEHDEQAELDSLYKLYLDGNYFTSLNKAGRSYKFYSQSELPQLVFRASKRTGLKTVTGVDYPVPFPYDSLMTAMKDAHQADLLTENENFFKKEDTTHHDNTLIAKLLAINTEKNRRFNRSWYLGIANRGSNDTTYVGAFLVSEWFRRNLYMYSTVQKNTGPADDRVILLLGEGHIAMIQQFIKDDDRFEIVELKDILK